MMIIPIYYYIKDEVLNRKISSYHQKYTSWKSVLILYKIIDFSYAVEVRTKDYLIQINELIPNPNHEDWKLIVANIKVQHFYNSFKNTLEALSGYKPSHEKNYPQTSFSKFHKKDNFHLK